MQAYKIYDFCLHVCSNNQPIAILPEFFVYCISLPDNCDKARTLLTVMEKLKKQKHFVWVRCNFKTDLLNVSSSKKNKKYINTK